MKVTIKWEALVKGKWIAATAEDILFRRIEYTAYREISRSVSA